MAQIQVVKVLLGLQGMLPEEPLAGRLPYPPRVVGQHLAEQVADYVARERLGYFPALDFFKGLNVVDETLLVACDDAAWVATSLARSEIQGRLRPIFSSVSIQSLQSLAHTMPTVRPKASEALESLARHYCPSRIRADIQVSLLNRREGVEESIEGYARRMPSRWLRPPFEEIEVTSSRLIESS